MLDDNAWEAFTHTNIHTYILKLKIEKFPTRD